MIPMLPLQQPRFCWQAIAHLLTPNGQLWDWQKAKWASRLPFASSGAFQLPGLLLP